LSRSLRFVALDVLLLVGAFTALRAAFLWIFHDPSDAPERGVLLQAFYLGLKFDLRLALLVHLPFALLGFLRPFDPFRSLRARRAWLAWFGFASAFLLFAYGVDLGHYGYLEARVDASVLRYLFDPRESAGVLWGSYPVLRGLAAVALAAAAHVWLLRRWFGGALPAPAPRPPLARAALVAAAACLYAFGLYGKISWYPLRWSDAYFSTHPFASALSLNPVLYFFETFDNRELEFDEAALRQRYAAVADYLGVERPDPDRLDFTRTVGERRSERLNVVIVLLESFSYYKTGLSGNPLDPTPNFDAIARDGVLFRRFYTPHSGTARSVFASVTGLPDIDRSKTSTRNPLIARQHTLLNAFAGWDKLYFLGGSASWGNIRALLSHNVDGLEIYEEGDYASPRVDVWGISDLHLLEEANRVLAARERPFVAIIQTAGNHKPYTIPEQSEGFVRSGTPEAEAQRFGFDSVPELDAMRLVDHSLGHFFRQARREAYFANTVFVLYGDHGSPAAPEHRPLAERQLRLPRYHVPLVFHAPGRLAPRVVDEVASQLDVLPTVLGLAGAAGVNSTLGRDLFDPAFAGRRYAFTVERIEKNPLLGIVSKDHYLQVAADGSRRELHRLESPSPRDDVSAAEPEAAAELEAVAFGLYEAARWMRYHNAPEQVAALRASAARDVAAGPPEQQARAQRRREASSR
jgi:phosphoglycerol transferase MdoB-like AlkP superfamily enzyme